MCAASRQIPNASCTIKIETELKMQLDAGTIFTDICMAAAPGAGNALSMSFANVNVCTQSRNKQMHTMCAYIRVCMRVRVLPSKFLPFVLAAACL